MSISELMFPQDTKRRYLNLFVNRVNTEFLTVAGVPFGPVEAKNVIYDDTKTPIYNASEVQAVLDNLKSIIDYQNKYLTNINKIYNSPSGFYSEINFEVPGLINVRPYSGGLFDTTVNDFNWAFNVAGSGVFFMGANAGTVNLSNLPLDMNNLDIIKCINTPKAWANIKGGSIITTYNIASCSQVSSGVWNHIFQNPLTNDAYAVIATAHYNGTSYVANFETRNTTDFNIVFEKNGGGLADPDWWSVQIFNEF